MNLALTRPRIQATSYPSTPSRPGGLHQALAVHFSGAKNNRNHQLMGASKLLVNYLRSGCTTAHKGFYNNFAAAVYAMHPQLQTINQATTDWTGQTTYNKLYFEDPRYGNNGEILLTCGVTREKGPCVVSNVKDTTIKPITLVIEHISENGVGIQKEGVPITKVVQIPMEPSRMIYS